MNQTLWKKIFEYNFDSPMSEYGFSTRLAHENYWTRNFTKKAILEYRKFMYLAATSDMMVSPSEIVDVVWHQHLIFTQSYSDFCNILGKQIQHVPSTHNHAEVEKFKLAKERTKKQYAATFGEQPAEIWEYSGMYETLRLEKAKIKIRTFILFGILAFACMGTPFYYLLKPFYIQMDSLHFLIGLTVLAGSILLVLELNNRSYLSQAIQKIGHNSFLSDLHPMELVYLEKQKMSNVINATMNQLIVDKKVIVHNDYTLERMAGSEPATLEEHQIMEALRIQGRCSYFALLRVLEGKPVFRNVANCMDAFKKYFIKSKKFGILFYINFGILSLALMLGFVRLVTGILRDKPIDYLVILLIGLLAVIGYQLFRLTKLVCTSTVPAFYRNEILPGRSISGDWEWQYFLLGSAVLTPAFIPIVGYVESHNNADTGSGSGSGTSCGSSCGSSCSSCGGCGGGD